MFSEELIERGFQNKKGFGFYFNQYVFQGVDLKNKKMADVGGGNGIASFYACMQEPSCQSWVIDPIAEGSNSEMMDQFSRLRQSTRCVRVNYHNGLITSLSEPQEFDIVLMHNSINHIVEDILRSDASEQKRFQERLAPVTERLKPGGQLIVAECGKQNFWDHIGLRSPFAPTIDWQIHEEPEFWSNILENQNCAHLKTNWSARRELRAVGKWLLANRIGSYFTNSHFVSHYIKL